MRQSVKKLNVKTPDNNPIRESKNFKQIKVNHLNKLDTNPGDKSMDSIIYDIE